MVIAALQVLHVVLLVALMPPRWKQLGLLLLRLMLLLLQLLLLLPGRLLVLL